MGGLQQRCWFEWEKTRFEVVNVHVSGMAPALEERRANELVNTNRNAEGLRTTPRDYNIEPLIIAGDLNGVRETAEPYFAGMLSAYDHPNAMVNNGPVITAHHDAFHTCGEIDKIYYSGPFKRARILQIQDEERLSANPMFSHPKRSMPHSDWPSDHVSLCADFYIGEAELVTHIAPVIPLLPHHPTGQNQH